LLVQFGVGRPWESTETGATGYMLNHYAGYSPKVDKIDKKTTIWVPHKDTTYKGSNYQGINEFHMQLLEGRTFDKLMSYCVKEYAKSEINKKSKKSSKKSKN